MDTTERDNLICRLRDEGASLQSIADRLARERADWAVSLGTISRALKKRGRQARPTRRDAGAPRRPRLTKQQEAAVVAILMGVGAKPSPGKLKRAAISTEMAIREAESQGIIPKGSVTVGWLNRRLRDVWNVQRRGAEARRTGPGVVRRFEAPRAGALYQFDGTLAQCFYIDASGDFTYHPHTEIKEQLKLAGKTRVYPFCVIDDHSRCVRLHAYDGETAAHVIDFLRRTLCRSNDPQRPLCGVPTALYADNGSALASAAAKRVLEAFGVRGQPKHKPREPWKKGKVERLFQTTRGYQELSRGRRLRSFVEFNEFLRQVEVELNNRVHSSTGMKPIERFLASAAQAAAEGKWRYADDDEALWRRLSMIRIDNVKVRADLVVSVGRGEQIALPHAQPYVDWIGKTITVYLDTPPEKRDGGFSDQECIVVDPLGRAEFSVPRRAPQIARSLVGRPAPTTAREELIAQAREQLGSIDPAMGQWIGDGGARVELPDAPAVSPAAAEQPASAMLTRHQVIGQLIDLQMFDASNPDDRRLVDQLMQGRDAIERARLDYLLDEGRLPEDGAEEAAA